MSEATATETKEETQDVQQEVEEKVEQEDSTPNYPVGRKEIQLRRKEKKSYLPNEVKANATKVIGSVYKDRRPLGIEDEDLEEKLLKDYVDLRPEDRNYGQQKRDFWKNMRVEVPHDGVILNIGVDESGEPLELEDFLIYKWLENHPLVAHSKAEMDRDSNKEYYLYDPEEEIHKEAKQSKLRRRAYKELIKMEEDDTVKDQIIRIMDGTNPERMSEDQKESKLDSLVSSQPKRFLRYAQDDNLEIRAEIEEMVEYGVLRKSGNQYIYMDEVIGDSMKDAIVYFKNERNSQQVLDMRGKLEEARKLG